MFACTGVFVFLLQISGVQPFALKEEDERGVEAARAKARARYCAGHPSAPHKRGEVERGLGLWLPSGDSPLGELVTERSLIGDQRQLGDAHTPFILTCLF